MYTDKTR